MTKIYFFLALIFSINAYGESSKPKEILIFGAGYVGTVSGACLAQCGHKITFIDPDADRINLLNNRKSPIGEPKVEELIKSGFEKNLLSAKCTLGHEIEKADMTFITVPTPASSDGIPDTRYIEEVLQLLQQNTQNRSTPLIVSIRSTLLPDSFRRLEKRYVDGSKLSLVVNPEFLRESTAVNDFFHPPLCLVGGDDPWAVQQVRSLYEDVSIHCVITSVDIACLLKYACNAFHALKIAFANEIATLCDAIQVNPVELMELFSEDTTLNCSSAYLKPGFAFGGSCLGKDLRTLTALGKNLEISLPVLSSILPSNQYRFQRLLGEILQNDHENLAFLGITFKKNSDDLRESPYVELMNHIHNCGISLRIFDPDINSSSPNWNSFRQKNRYISDLICQDLNTALKGCDGVILCKDLLDSETARELKQKKIPLYDLGYFVSNSR